MKRGKAAAQKGNKRETVTQSRKANVIQGILLAIIGVTVLFIWSNSLEAPAESQEKSQWVMELITPILELFVGKGNVTEFLVRKLAHFSEFGLLGGELSLLLTLRRKQTIPWYVNLAGLAFVTAALDETIQIFSGRGSSLADVWLDFAGALTGILGVFGISFVVRLLKGRKKETGGQKRI